MLTSGSVQIGIVMWGTNEYRKQNRLEYNTHLVSITLQPIMGYTTVGKHTTQPSKAAQRPGHGTHISVFVCTSCDYTNFLQFRSDPACGCSNSLWKTAIGLLKCLLHLWLARLVFCKLRIMFYLATHAFTVSSINTYLPEESKRHLPPLLLTRLPYLAEWPFEDKCNGEKSMNKEL